MTSYRTNVERGNTADAELSVPTSSPILDFLACRLHISGPFGNRPTIPPTFQAPLVVAYRHPVQRCQLAVYKSCASILRRKRKLLKIFKATEKSSDQI